MENFVTDYVEGYLECLGVNLEENRDKISKVIKYIACDDHWFDVLDNEILDTCDRFGISIGEED